MIGIESSIKSDFDFFEFMPFPQVQRLRHFLRGALDPAAAPGRDAAQPRHDPDRAQHHGRRPPHAGAQPGAVQRGGPHH